MTQIISSSTRQAAGGKWVEIWSDSQLCAKVLVFDEPSEDYGIDGGRISKLSIQRYTCAKNSEVSKTWEAIYDRGWDMMPKAEDTIAFLNEIKNLYK